MLTACLACACVSLPTAPPCVCVLWRRGRVAAVLWCRASSVSVPVALAARLLSDGDWSVEPHSAQAARAHEGLEMQQETQLLCMLKRHAKQRELRQLPSASSAAWSICRGCNRDHWATKGFIIDAQKLPPSLPTSWAAASLKALCVALCLS